MPSTTSLATIGSKRPSGLDVGCIVERLLRVGARGRLGGGDIFGLAIRQRWPLGSFWAHPERVLDETARNATSGFARMEPQVVQRVVQAVARDFESGVWDARHGHLRTLTEYGAGLRLVIAQ